MLKIAIVGNVASGKSTVENILQKRGYKVFDTDKIAHVLLDDSKELILEFKKDNILTNGKVDRKKLAQVVFNDSKKMKLLESIIHPKVKDEIQRIFDSIYAEAVFISVPQLFEAGFEDLFDKIIFISTPASVRLERLIKRNNLEYDDAMKRLNSQGDEKEKMLKSDFVIVNDSTLEDLEKKVDKVLASIC